MTAPPSESRNRRGRGSGLRGKDALVRAGNFRLKLCHSSLLLGSIYGIKAAHRHILARLPHIYAVQDSMWLPDVLVLGFEYRWRYRVRELRGARNPGGSIQS